MAGDWIKVRKCLYTHPKVARIAAMVGLGEAETVGLLGAVWSWADDVTDDGHVANLSPSDADRLSRVCPGFVAAMSKVGWIIVDDEGICFPEYDAHMSNSAKKRALKTRQKQQERDRKRVAKVSPTNGDTKATREEKRREEKRRKRERGRSPKGLRPPLTLIFQHQARRTEATRRGMARVPSSPWHPC